MMGECVCVCSLQAGQIEDSGRVDGRTESE